MELPLPLPAELAGATFGELLKHLVYVVQVSLPVGLERSLRVEHVVAVRAKRLAVADRLLARARRACWVQVEWLTVLSVRPATTAATGWEPLLL
ncbi:hypothetical protein MRX96_028003 [Rhipicephalus microplus]